ncbi:MAG: hypothetical protein K2Z81_25415, partial [Cyanobacteria bacterium]|nr:hypothetical protein [Cyanobacteriota bacterium]
LPTLNIPHPRIILNKKFNVSRFKSIDLANVSRLICVRRAIRTLFHSNKKSADTPLTRPI